MKPIHSSMVALLIFLAGIALIAPHIMKARPDSAVKAKSAISPTVVPAQKVRQAESYGELPLSFEANQGQTDSRVKFLSRGRGYSLFLTGDEAVLSLPGARQSMGDKKLAKFAASHSPLAADAKTGRRTIGDADKTKGNVLQMKLVGANANAAVTGADELPGKSNYFIGNDPKKWRTNVPTYAKVKYQNVYPGVNLVYYGNQSGQLEYDFVVAPGADPSAIKLDVGTEGVRADRSSSTPRITADGDLVIKSNGGEIRFH
jgi:hypothetical protein